MGNKKEERSLKWEQSVGSGGVSCEVHYPGWDERINATTVHDSGRRLGDFCVCLVWIQVVMKAIDQDRREKRLKEREKVVERSGNRHHTNWNVSWENREKHGIQRKILT